MKYEYHLLNKSGEIISKVKTESMELAIELFSLIKKLDPSKLLEIYNVKKK
jgi:hypothetical protein